MVKVTYAVVAATAALLLAFTPAVAGGPGGAVDSCPGDTNDDGEVDVNDLNNVILDWGTDGSANGGDVNGSGNVNVDDLVIVIVTWGPCPLGRCCFTGIVFPPFLCEVTTEAECEMFVGSFWTPGITCDEPCPDCPVFCPPDQPCFEGCGELVQGVECVLFQADAGGLFVLSNLGAFNVGDRVEVIGCLDPNCITFCQQGNGCILNNTIAPCPEELGRCCFVGIIFPPFLCAVTTEAECEMFVESFWTPGITCDEPCSDDCPAVCPPDQPCFEGCGELVQGVECVLFQADAGGLFVLANLGGFNVGDRVEVVGCLDPDCITFCQQGNGCILNNTIAPCPEALGRCCFTGIIFPPYLCEVTTELACSFFVGGIWTPGETCDTPCPPGCSEKCPSGQSCFAGCGVLVQGVECVLFVSPAGGMLVPENLGGFGPGDVVYVEGCLDPNCVTFCQQGGGCVTGNIITACGP